MKSIVACPAFPKSSLLISQSLLQVPVSQHSGRLSVCSLSSAALLQQMSGSLSQLQVNPTETNTPIPTTESSVCYLGSIFIVTFANTHSNVSIGTLSERTRTFVGADGFAGCCNPSTFLSALSSVLSELHFQVSCNPTVSSR